MLWCLFFGQSVRTTELNKYVLTSGHESWSFTLGWIEVIMCAVVPMYPMWIMMLVAGSRDREKEAVLGTLDPVTTYPHVSDDINPEEAVKMEERNVLLYA